MLDKEKNPIAWIKTTNPDAYGQITWSNKKFAIYCSFIPSFLPHTGLLDPWRGMEQDFVKSSQQQDVNWKKCKKDIFLSLTLSLVPYAALFWSIEGDWEGIYSGGLIYGVGDYGERERRESGELSILEHWGLCSGLPGQKLDLDVAYADEVGVLKYRDGKGCVVEMSRWSGWSYGGGFESFGQGRLKIFGNLSASWHSSWRQFSRAQIFYFSIGRVKLPIPEYQLQQRLYI